MKLPAPDWLARRGVRQILAALDTPPGAARVVGGAVRDALLGLPVADIDLATQHVPAEIVRRLEAAGLKAVPTGIAHGTVTAVAPDAVVEVTTLRRDVATFGRHAEVAFTDDWRADAARRDFTINALYARADTLDIDDYFGGLDDLAARRVRFIGDPLARIAEDHLRILRFFRFHARFASGEPDAAALAACTARARDLMALSRERIQGELSRLLAVADPLPTVAVMLEREILRPVLPEIEAARLPALTAVIAAEAASGAPPAWLRRLAALLPADPALLDAVATRLRLSNADRKRLVAMAGGLDGDPFARAWTEGAEAVVDRALLAGRTDLPLAALAAWERPALPASGRDLIARGVAPGPEVSRRLAAFEREWVAQGFPRDPLTVGALLDAAAR